MTLWLPEAACAAAPAGDAGAGASGPARLPVSGRVMLVDDDDLVRETIAAFLEDEGFGVLLAGSGPEALALLAAGDAVDVLVTDLSMPGMDGIAIIQAAQARRPGLPALLLTGYAHADAVAAMDGSAGARFSLLRKPVRGGELVQRIHETIRDVQGSAVDPHGTQRPIAQSASTPRRLHQWVPRGFAPWSGPGAKPLVGSGATPRQPPRRAARAKAPFRPNSTFQTQPDAGCARTGTPRSTSVRCSSRSGRR